MAKQTLLYRKNHTVIQGRLKLDLPLKAGQDEVEVQIRPINESYHFGGDILKLDTKGISFSRDEIYES